MFCQFLLDLWFADKVWVSLQWLSKILMSHHSSQGWYCHKSTSLFLVCPKDFKDQKNHHKSSRLIAVELYLQVNKVRDQKQTVCAQNKLIRGSKHWASSFKPKKTVSVFPWLHGLNWSLLFFMSADTGISLWKILFFLVLLRVAWCTWVQYQHQYPFTSLCSFPQSTPLALRESGLQAFW